MHHSHYADVLGLLLRQACAAPPSRPARRLKTETAVGNPRAFRDDSVSVEKLPDLGAILLINRPHRDYVMS